MQQEKTDKKNYSLPVALLLIIASIFVISGSFYSFFFLYVQFHKSRLHNSKYQITKIIQTGPRKKAVNSQYLAELMGLSADRPLNLFIFNEKKGEEKLLQSPIIRFAKVEKMKPDSLYIDYDIREPLAFLHDYENIAVDQEGYIFPMHPFYFSQNLPVLYLGLAPFKEEQENRETGSWNQPLKGPHMLLALEMLEVFSRKKFPFEIQRIDVSNAFLSSYGRREIVLFVSEKAVLSTKKNSCLCVFPKVLRLSPKSYEQQLNNFLILRESMLEDYRKQVRVMEITNHTLEFSPQVIDFRIDELAFIKES